MTGYIPKPSFITGLDSNVTLSQGILGAWPMGEENPDIVYNATGDGCDGAINGTVTTQSGSYGTSKYIGTTNQNGYNVSGGASYIDVNEPFTVSWIQRLDSFHTSFPLVGMFKGTGSHGLQIFLSESAGYSGLTFGVFSTSHKVGSLSTSEYLNKTCVMMLTYNGDGFSTNSNFNFYINGLQKDVASGAAISNFGNSTNFGKVSTSTNPPDALYENFVVWDRELDQNEATLYAYSPFSIYETIEEQSYMYPSIAPPSGFGSLLSGQRNQLVF